MPDAIETPVAPSPATLPVEPPSSAITGTPVPESTTGSASLVDEMEALIASKPPEKKEPERGPDGKLKPAEPKPEAAKPTEKPPEKTPEKPKVEPPKEPVKETGKDPVALRKRLAEVEGQLKQTQAEKQAELSKLNDKIAELEKRRYLTPEQEQRQAAMEKRAKELEGELIARDYRKSPEFQREYQEKWQSAYEDAVADVGQLKIVDQEGAEPRMATRADFEKIRLAGGRVQQRTLARAMFPEDNDLVLNHINTLASIEKSAQDAIARKQASFETEQQQESQAYQSKYQEVDANLVAKYPNFFGEDPAMPEATTEMQKGLDYVDKAMEQSVNAPVAERAALAATLRRWAGSFPRMVYVLNKKDAQIAELTERLAKFEATDPGSGGDAPSPTPESKSLGGVDAMAAEFDKLGQ